MGERRTTYLIQDPYDLDAVQFIRTIDLDYGIRPICLYTSAKDRFYGELDFPILTSDLIEASIDVEPDDLSSVVEQLREYDVCGVVPYREDTVEVAAELCELLGLGWNSPETLRRFRDKFEQKTYLREIDPTIRVPECRLIATADDLNAGALPERYVLKPNDGLGNRSIGMFGADDLAAARAHLDRESGPFILEGFIGGIEYHIDGQVRGEGDVESLAVYEYVRTEVNGYPTVYLGELLCPTTDPRFDRLVDYADRLLTATGLRRCPFHLEVKVDDEGPCLVDLGARLPSEGGGRTISRLHPGRPDAYAIAAHDYLGINAVATGPIDWTAYDRARTVLVYGVSEEVGLIASVGGVEAVEAMPEFVRWAVRPGVGDPLVATTDLRGAPFIVELSCVGDRSDALALMEEVRSLVTWNVDAGRRAAEIARAGSTARRARRKLHWLLHQRMQRAR